MQIALAAIFGLIFGTGILISGMGNPAKILNFFDLAGHWDPSLAFVMGGALLVTAIGYRLAFARAKPMCEPNFALPTSTKIDTPLLAGSALFGLGWGIAGFCPGGSIPMLASGYSQPVLFVASMIASLIATRYVRARNT